MDLQLGVLPEMDMRHELCKQVSAPAQRAAQQLYFGNLELGCLRLCRESQFQATTFTFPKVVIFKNFVFAVL